MENTTFIVPLINHSPVSLPTLQTSTLSLETGELYGIPWHSLLPEPDARRYWSDGSLYSLQPVIKTIISVTLRTLHQSCPGGVEPAPLVFQLRLLFFFNRKSQERKKSQEPRITTAQAKQWLHQPKSGPSAPKQGRVLYQARQGHISVLHFQGMQTGAAEDRSKDE